MALPKKHKVDNNLQGNKIGLDRRTEMKDMIAENEPHLPKGVLHSDLDGGFKRFVKENLKINKEDGDVPVLMMGIHGWNEFSRTWRFQDQYKNLEFPFITIIRNPVTEYGSNPSLQYNIPVNRKFTYAKVPTWDGNRKGVDLYKIPQPIPVDIEYEVKIFSYQLREINDFNLKVLHNFNSRQAYTVVNGHYIPIILEGQSDESQIDDISKRQFYVVNYNFMMQGIILDPNEFEVVSAVNRVITFTDLSKK